MLLLPKTVLVLFRKFLVYQGDLLLGNWRNDEVLAIRQTYYAMVAEADAMVGLVLGLLCT